LGSQSQPQQQVQAPAAAHGEVELRSVLQPFGVGVARTVVLAAQTASASRLVLVWVAELPLVEVARHSGWVNLPAEQPQVLQWVGLPVQQAVTFDLGLRANRQLHHR
jgi:hypothetical protein